MDHDKFNRIGVMAVKGFEKVLEAARAALAPRQLTKNCSAGSVAAAIETESGNVYAGVCIDTPCSMGFCAEHAAAAAMVTAGENKVVRMAAVHGTGTVVAPCGRCREFICQLHEENERCLVLLADGNVKTLEKLLPDRWK